MSLRFAAYYKYVKRRAQKSIYVAWLTSEDDYLSASQEFFQYLGCDRAKEKKEGVGVFFFLLVRVFGSLLVFRV